MEDFVSVVLSLRELQIMSMGECIFIGITYLLRMFFNINCLLSLLNNYYFFISSERYVAVMFISNWLPAPKYDMMFLGCLLSL